MFILFVHEVLCPFLHVVRLRQNFTIKSLIETTTKDDKSDVEFWVHQGLLSLKVF